MSNSEAKLFFVDPLVCNVQLVASCSARGLSCIAEDWIITTQTKGTSICVWRCGQKSPLYKCRLPESIGPIVVSPDGAYCFGGSISGILYSWELSSGRLIRSWNGHHKAVRCLGLTDDCSYLVSGGEDAVISVWPVLDLVDADDVQTRVSEGHSWTQHSLAVTNVHVGRGGLCARVFSSSLDRTVCVFEIFSKQLLFTIACGVFLTSVVTTPDESWLFVGCGDGGILAVDLRTNDSASNMITMEGHSGVVTDLLSVDQGTILLSSSEDGTVKVWDVSSRQCVQSIDLKEPVSCLAAVAKSAHCTNVNEHDLVPFAPLKKFGNAVMPTTTSLLPLRRTVSSHSSW